MAGLMWCLCVVCVYGRGDVRVYVQCQNYSMEGYDTGGELRACVCVCVCVWLWMLSLQHHEEEDVMMVVGGGGWW